MTKTERIFKESCEMCEAYIATNGVKWDDTGRMIGPGHLSLRDDDRLTIKVLQELHKELACAFRAVDLLLRFKAIDQEEYRKRSDTYHMVARIVNDEIDKLAEGRA